MRHLHWVTCVFFASLLLTLPTADAWAVRAYKNMLNARLAEVELTTKADLKMIDDLGGLIDRVDGNRAEVYLLDEDFEQLRARGFSIRWIRDLKTEFLEELWERTRDTRNPLDDYHSNDEIQAAFNAWQSAYPGLFRFESIGLSVQGRNLWVAKVSDNVSVDEPEIEIKYVSTMHGNEPVGTENILRFIDTLLTGYGTEPELTQLVNEFELWFLPMMNPDGNALARRTNANGVDLNRNFPDRVDDSVNTIAGRQPETALMMNWSAQRNFVLSANYHTGTVVVNYPWDNNYNHANVDSPTPEDALFRHLSLQYSVFNSRMYNSPTFPQGITNGADWYAISGGMQDWNYTWMGDKDVTIELDGASPPPPGQLEALWLENRTSMKRYLQEALYGVRGVVTDSATGLPLRANISVNGNPYLTYSSALHGEYYRILLNGSYSFAFSAPGYAPKTIAGVTVNRPAPTILNVQLARIPSPVISTNPQTVSRTLEVCSMEELPFTILNNGAATLNWSAVEGYVNPGGYGSSVGGGWRFIDSQQPGGPAYNWVDISISGTPVTFTADDQNLGPFAIGFAFPFYGQNFTQVRISANGWLSFTSTADQASSYLNTILPSPAAPENLIAPWWDDLSPHRTGASVRRYTNNVDSFIVTYSNVQSYTGGGVYTFQVILLRSGDIRFQYNNMGTVRLNSATIGLQNSTRTRGSTVVQDQNYIGNARAIAYCANSMVELSPATGSIPAQSSAAVTMRLRSCCLPLGISNGILALSSNDPVTPLMNVPITIDVTTTPPEAVTNLAAAPEAGGIRLRWSAAPFATGYQVYRMSDASQDHASGTLLTPDPITATTFFDPSASLFGFYVVISVR